MSVPSASSKDFPGSSRHTIVPHSTNVVCQHVSDSGIGNVSTEGSTTSASTSSKCLDAKESGRRICITSSCAGQPPETSLGNALHLELMRADPVFRDDYVDPPKSSTEILRAMDILKLTIDKAAKENRKLSILPNSVSYVYNLCIYAVRRPGFQPRRFRCAESLGKETRELVEHRLKHFDSTRPLELSKREVFVLSTLILDWPSVISKYSGSACEEAACCLHSNAILNYKAVWPVRLTMKAERLRQNLIDFEANYMHNFFARLRNRNWQPEWRSTAEATPLEPTVLNDDFKRSFKAVVERLRWGTAQFVPVFLDERQVVIISQILTSIQNAELEVQVDEDLRVAEIYSRFATYFEVWNLNFCHPLLHITKDV